MEKIKDSKWLYIVLSVLMAFFLWLYVREVNPGDVSIPLRNIPVEFQGVEILEDRGLMISEGASQSVTLNVRSSLDVFRKMSSSEVRVALNLSNITEPGEYRLNTEDCRIEYPSYIFTTSIIEQSIVPASITITVSRRATRTVEVRGQFTGSVDKDYQRGEFEVSPGTVEISGREELINRVDYARVVISGEDLTASVTERLPLSFIDISGDEIEEKGITASVSEVDVTLPIYQLKEVPLRVNLLPGGGATEENATITVDIEPKTIMVSGEAKDLEGLKEIVLGEIDLSQIYNRATREFAIQLSPALNNLTGEGTASVTVTISGLSTRTILVDNIEVINKPNGYQVQVITKSREVQIRGTEEAVNAVVAGQLRIVVDLENNITALGTQPVPARVYLDNAGEVGVVGGTYNVMISVTR